MGSFFCYVCVLVYVLVYVHARVCTCVWRPEDNLQCHSLSLFTFYFLAGVTHGLERAKKARMPGQRAPGMGLFLLPFPLLLYMSWDQIQGPCLLATPFTD